MSEYKCVQRAASTSAARATCTSKPSKPFCSLAYLAKSTAAINTSSDVRIMKGPDQKSFTDPSSTPNVAATAKVNERGSPGLPTGAATVIREHGNKSQQPNDDASATSYIVNGQFSGMVSSEERDGNNHSRSIVEVFGVINEEDATPTTDQVDGTDARRPWELGTHNGYVRRIPPALITPANAQNGFPHCSNGLPSLSKLNSMDCWDYTIELECLNGPQG